MIEYFIKEENLLIICLENNFSYKKVKDLKFNQNILEIITQKKIYKINFDIDIKNINEVFIHNSISKNKNGTLFKL